LTRKNTKRGLGVGLLVLFVLGAAAAGWFYRDYRMFSDSALAPLAEATTMDVPLGTSLSGVLRLVEQRGIRIGNLLHWRLLARELGVAGRLQAGEYALTPGLTPAELLKKMAAGDVVQHHFTIVEGWTFKQLRLALAQDAGLQQTLAAVDDTEIIGRLGAPGALAEGWFLPETYSYVKGMSDLDVLRRAHDSMHKLLDALWGGHPVDFVLDSPYQLLILASIVEKETAQPDERPLIAGVFLHRLRLGMRLQGKASIEAVMHPAATDALYFVARGDGTHEFSATLDAHNQAVARYQIHQNR
jgi:UPF0755 protein